MPRYKLTIEYDGTPFIGWQAQDNGPSVQGAITDAISAFTGERVTVSGAGRTDTGVHALAEVAPEDLSRQQEHDTVRCHQFPFAPATRCGAEGGARDRRF